MRRGDYVGEIDLDALGRVVRIKKDVDAGRLANCLVDDLCVLGVMQGERLVGDGLELDRSAHGIEFFTRTGILREAGLRARTRRFAVLETQFGNLLLRCFVAGVDLGGMKQFDQRALLIASLHESAALG